MTPTPSNIRRPALAEAGLSTSTANRYEELTA
jgi:hypothetical protein